MAQLASPVRPCAGKARSDEGGVRRMSIASPFSLCVVAMTALAFLGLPIGHAMIAGSILYLALAGLDMGTAAEQFLNGMYTNYIILAVPLFILAAELMNIGSMTDRLMAFCNAIVGRFRGGLAYVNIVQSVIFAGMSGSAIADAAGTGKMMQQMMTKDGKYPASYAAALTAVTAVIGPIIPPSIPMVIYALVSDASIGYLFLGGVVPGLLMAFAQMVIVFFDARRRMFPVEEPTPLRELPLITWRAFPSLTMPVVLLGGIYSGATTPTEAAAVAGAYALLISVVLYRSVSFADFYRSILASARTTASIGMLIAGALVFNYVVTVENIPQSLSVILRAWDLSPLGFLILANVILLILGCVLEGTTILLVVVPVLIPTAQALGVDMVHFGVVVVVNIMLGLVTPPYGLLLFIMTRIAEVPLRALVRDTLPFLAAMVIALALITLFPGLVLWLPRVFGYHG
jgi:C4-dicarboxylate transporter, DctM subunit